VLLLGHVQETNELRVASAQVAATLGVVVQQLATQHVGPGDVYRMNLLTCQQAARERSRQARL
jgi:hypothetical protein